LSELPRASTQNFTMIEKSPGNNFPSSCFSRADVRKQSVVYYR
jgi:hypothetical protein